MHVLVTACPVLLPRSLLHAHHLQLHHRSVWAGTALSQPELGELQEGTSSPAAFPHVSDQLQDCPAVSGSVTSSLAACTSCQPRSLAQHKLQHLLAVPYLPACSWQWGESFSSAPTATVGRSPGTQGRSIPGCALPQLCSAWGSASCCILWGSLSSLQVLADPPVLCHISCSGSSALLSQPLCLWSLLAAPGLLPYSETREQV